MPGLGRRHSVDHNDQKFLLKHLLPSKRTRPTRILWPCDWIGDQGETPQCVGYAWYGVLKAGPRVHTGPAPEVIYQQAQLRDEWPGENYEGTSVRGAAKALKLDDGLLTRYGWAFDVPTCLSWLGFHGPMCFGTNWYEAMFTPDAHSVVSIGGAIAGGHAYLVLGYDDAEGVILCQNSWGTSWGASGRFAMTYATAQRLLVEDGEACTPTEIV